MVIAIMVSQEDNPMDIKVNDVSRVMPVENQTKTSQADGSFKFILASNVEDAELNSRLNQLMTQITDRKSTRLNSSHRSQSRMPSSA